MPGPELPTPYRVSPNQIATVLGDLGIVESGARLLFCIDPYEIVNYCFPVTPGTSAIRTGEIERICDGQAAFEYAIFSRDFAPFIIPEYAAELNRYLDHLEHDIGHAYDKADLVHTLELLAGNAEREPAHLTDFVEKNKGDFSVSLAVTLGTISIGVQRFREVVRRCRESIEDNQLLAELNKAFAPGPVSETIFKSLEEGILTKRTDPIDQRRRLRSALVDATAIDRIFFLNSELEKRYKQGELKRRIVLLYLSSAHRNAGIFSIRAVQASYPIIAGEPYQIWRTRDQLFVSLMHKGNGRTSIPAAKEAIRRWTDRYTRVRSLYENLQQASGSECGPGQCVLQGGAQRPECKWAQLCHELDADAPIIEARRVEVRNLALIAAINTYKRILDSFDQLQNDPDPTRRIQVVLTAVRSASIRDEAMERMAVANSVLVTNSELKVLSIAERQGLSADAIESRDEVTNVIQALPSDARFEQSHYDALAQKLIYFYAQRHHDVVKVAEFVEQIQEEFALLEVHTPEPNAELEMLRSYLYLAYPRRSGEMVVLRTTKSNCERFPEKQTEFLYLACWAARRIERYQESISYAEEGLASDPDDPRFYHGLSLAQYCWLMTDTTHLQCQWTLHDVLENAIKALELFERDPNRYRDTLCAGYNNVAYFLLQLNVPSRVEEAFEYFMKLKLLLPQEAWTTSPEYFHTEAELWYTKYLITKQSGVPKRSLSQYLRTAHQSIEEAQKLKPCEDYRRLARKIRRRLQRTGTQ